MAKVIKLGLGEVVSNWGTHNGVPAIFIEPAYAHSGEIGRVLDKHEKPHIRTDAVHEDGIILEIHSAEGMQVVIEDMGKAIGAAAMPTQKAADPKVVEVWNWLADNADRFAGSFGLKEEFQPVAFAGYAVALQHLAYALQLPVEAEDIDEESAHYRQIRQRFPAAPPESKESE